ncbi:MAG: tetratricopeptide repeat protein [Desulfobacteraceae bacterium]|jgi:tetratricopeptide (TPR) repeat protein
MSRPWLDCLWKWVLAGWISLWIPSSAIALTIESDQQLAYADALFNNQQYLRAAQEYQRFVFFFPDHPKKRLAIFKTGQSFYSAKDPGRAIELFESLTQVQPLDELATEAFFKMSECYLSMNTPPHAVVQLNKVIALSDDPAIEDRAYYRIGWIHIDLADWTGAQMAFGKMSPAGRQRYKLADLTKALSNRSDIPTKSPYLAGTLSIIPGAGQLYCHRYEDGIIAFAVNTAFIWAAVDAFNEEQYGLGGLLSFVGLGFYAGNIYGAVNDAYKYNHMQTRRFVDELRRHQVQIAGPSRYGAARKGLTLSLKIPF